MPRPIIHDGETQREMTAAEYAEWKKLSDECVAAKSARIAAKEQQIVDSESARAKLIALGLTENEIAALVG